MLEMDFNIQMFAEGGEGEQQTSQSTDTADNSENSEQKQSGKSAEVDIDTKIAEAVAKAQKSFEEALKKREADRKKEEERLSKLSDDERQKAEIESGRKELELKEKELQRKELMLEMTKVMAERNLPVEFTEYLIAEDNESTLKRITTFEKKFKAAVEAEVNERLKGKAPQSGNKNPSGGGNTSRAKDDTLKIILDNQVKRG